ncbi:hypothetical protein Patl1_21226 [Pistacia atlantica]|uniref:Uncharacterized protein n=1 Tax=Pistacia atlantica TaxID=434234 RepID=A0ACC1BHK7_9ROSI|nr:hypothetical protein Patl1_21226 [Pistacia atlantica]
MHILQGLLSLPSACSVGAIDQQLLLKQSHDGEASVGVTSVLSDGDNVENYTADEQCLPKSPSDQITCPGVDVDVAGLEKVSVSNCTSNENPASFSVPSEVKVENFGNHVFSSLGDGVNDFVGNDAPADKVNTNIPNDFANDDLDHIVLKERQRMLLKRRSLDLGNRVVEVIHYLFI